MTSYSQWKFVRRASLIKIKDIKQANAQLSLDMLCWAVDFNFKFPKRTFFGAMLWDFLSWKKSSLSKAWPVLDSCKHNSYILPRDNNPVHVLLIPHTPLPLPGVTPPKLTFKENCVTPTNHKPVSHFYLRPIPWYLINCSLQCDETLVILVGPFLVRKRASILLILVWYRVWFRFSFKWIRTVGFHLTSRKFKLENYRPYWDFTFTMH